MPWEWSATAIDPAAARRLRGAFREHLAQHAAPEADIDGAELIFAELINNVIRHAPGPVSFRLEWDCERPTLRVFDDGDGFAKMPQPTLANVYAEDGRGLGLIQAVGGQTIVRNRRNGRSAVSCVLPVWRSLRAV